jgi:hypothetical protein
MSTESEDIAQEERALDALIALTLMSDDYDPTPEEIDEFMNGDTDLSDEDMALLDKVGKELPAKCREWQAQREGVLVAKDECDC